MKAELQLDDSLVSEAMAVSGCCSAQEVVETGVRLLVRMKSQEQLLALRGELPWEGNLDEMRRDDDAR